MHRQPKILVVEDEAPIAELISGMRKAIRLLTCVVVSTSAGMTSLSLG